MARAVEDTEERQRLSELCADCILLVIQLHVTKAIENPEKLRRSIRDLFDDLDRNARRARYETEEVQNAKFALVAFLDEVVAGSEWDGKDSWLAYPLQLEHFNRNDAGEEFFARLELLRKRPQANAQVLEVYYLCLALGFKGKYAFQDTERLRTLVEDTEHDLRRGREGEAERVLAPHGKPRETLGDVVRNDVPLWVIAVVAFAIGFFFFLVMTFVIGGSATDVARAIQGIG